MRRFIISESAADFASHAGLEPIGMALKRHTDLAADTAAIGLLRGNAVGLCDVLASYVAMLRQGKSELEAISGFREDECFNHALGLKRRRERIGLGRSCASAHLSPCNGIFSPPNGDLGGE